MAKRKGAESNQRSNSVPGVVYLLSGEQPRDNMMGDGRSAIDPLEFLVVRVAFGETGTFGMVVRDFDADGRSLSQSEVKLSNGAHAFRWLPGWAGDHGVAYIGPILDNQGVPGEVVTVDKARPVLSSQDPVLGVAACSMSGTAIR